MVAVSVTPFTIYLSTRRGYSTCLVTKTYVMGYQTCPLITSQPHMCATTPSYTEVTPCEAGGPKWMGQPQQTTHLGQHRIWNRMAASWSGTYWQRRMILFSTCKSLIQMLPPTYRRRWIKSTNHRAWKKRKYLNACIQHHCKFSPFVVSLGGLICTKAESMLECLASCLADKWRKPYYRMFSYFWSRVSVIMVPTTHCCIREYWVPAISIRIQWS